MRTVIGTIVSITTALWLGAIVALFIFVQVLFKENRDVAVQAAPVMFRVFESYQMALALTALAFAVAWNFAGGSGLRSRVTVLLLLGAALLPALVSFTSITPKMEALRQQGKSDSPEFRTLHGQSMVVYTVTALFVLMAAATIPAAVKDKTRKKKLIRPAAPNAEQYETAGQSSGG